jgi:hypothetical protein
MKTKNIISKDAKRPMLDDTDKRILQILKEDFPFIEQPWSALRGKLVAAVINQYSNISHNYEREHEYNVWFTLRNAQKLSKSQNCSQKPLVLSTTLFCIVNATSKDSPQRRNCND